MTYRSQSLRGSFENTSPTARLRTWIALSALVTFSVLVIDDVGQWFELGGPLLPNSGLTVAAAWVGPVALTMWPLIRRWATRTAAAGTLLSTLVGFLAFAPVLAWLALQLLVHPILHAERCRYCDPHGRAVWAGLLLGAGSGVVAIAVGYVVELACRRFGVRHVRRLTKALALSAATAALILVAMAAIASARRPNPSWSDYVAHLPVLAELREPPADDSTATPQLPWSRLSGTPPRYEAIAGDIRVLAWSDTFAVWFKLFAHGSEDSTELAASAHRLAKQAHRDESGRLILRRDSSHDLLLVETPYAPHGRFGSFSLYTSRLAFRASTLRKVDVTPFDFVRESGAPTAWLLAAGVGMAMAAFSVRWRSRSIQQRADHRAWRSGQADMNGIVTLETGRRCRRCTASQWGPSS